MKFHSFVDVVTNSSSSIFTVLNGDGSADIMKTFLVRASKFFGSDVKEEDIKVDVVRDSQFIKDAVHFYENNEDYKDLVPEDMTPYEYVMADPWEVFYQLAYYEDLGEPYKMTIKNLKTGEFLEIGLLYQIFIGIQSGDG